MDSSLATAGPRSPVVRCLGPQEGVAGWVEVARNEWMKCLRVPSVERVCALLYTMTDAPPRSEPWRGRRIIANMLLSGLCSLGASATPCSRYKSHPLWACPSGFTGPLDPITLHGHEGKKTQNEERTEKAYGQREQFGCAKERARVAQGCAPAVPSAGGYGARKKSGHVRGAVPVVRKEARSRVVICPPAVQGWAGGHHWRSLYALP
jgi:hypothetical protein